VTTSRMLSGKFSAPIKEGVSASGVSASVGYGSHHNHKTIFDYILKVITGSHNALWRATS
jgi:hypothetical protein